MTNIMELNQNLFPSGKIETHPSYSTEIYSLAGNQQITKKQINNLLSDIPLKKLNFLYTFIHLYTPLLRMLKQNHSNIKLSQNLILSFFTCKKMIKFVSAKCNKYF